MKRAKKYCALGKLISKRLIDLEKTQIWLAENSKVQPCLISKYCTGDSIPSAQNIYKLSSTLNISTDEIIQAIMSKTEKIVS